MKNRAFIIAAVCTGALSVALLSAGCKPSAETQAKHDINKIETETKDASAQMANYTYAQKDQFVQAMQAQLDALGQDLDKLDADIKNANADVQAQAQPKLQALRDEQTQLKQQFNELKSANESTWDNVKSSFNQAYDKAADSVNQARAWLSQKIAP